MARKSEHRVSLTNARIGQLKPRTNKDGKPVDGFVYDTNVPNLAVRVRLTGDKAFYIRYSNGKTQRWVKLKTQPPGGTIEFARKEARRLLGQLSNGEDPAKARDDRRKVGDVKDLCDRFIEEARIRLKEKTVKEYAWQIDRYIVPAIGSRPVAEVDGADLEAIHREVADRPILSNRLHSLLHRMFNQAVRWKLRKDNPATGHERNKERPRLRWLSAVELQALGEAIATAREDGSIPSQALDAVEALLLSGLRVREVLSLKWRDLDFDASVVHLADTKTGPRDASLNQALRDLLEARRPRTKEQRLSQWVFSPESNGSRPLSYAIFRLHWIALAGKAGIETARIHDLRRSVGTHAVSSLNVTHEALAGVLGHRDLKSTKVYGLLAATARAQASEKIGDLMAAHLKGRKKGTG